MKIHMRYVLLVIFMVLFVLCCLGLLSQTQTADAPTSASAICSICGGDTALDVNGVLRCVICDTPQF